ncbi:MAG TPA: hypothetical protein VES94_00925, partial [Burkholderiales bacterium]|nr:hypothetical protein [Burkholderiales bacterium]
SLTFGRTGYEKSLFRCRKNGKDINRDGRNDMVCYFKPDIANFQTGDLNGKLEGKTMSGQRIKGAAALRIFSVPRERHGFKHHGERHRDDRKNHKDHDGDDRKNHNGNSNR